MTTTKRHENGAIFLFFFAFISSKFAKVLKYFAQIFKYYAQLCDCMIAAF